MTNTVTQKNIPNGWSSTELGLVSDITMGQSPSSENYNQDQIGLPFFQGKADFTDDLGVKIRQWTSEVTKESKPGDILMSVRAPVGDVAINNVEACIGRGLAAIRAKENISEQQFLFQVLQYLKDELNKKAQGSTFTAINGPSLKKIQIKLPPLFEQKKIAEILGSVDDEMTKIEEIISATEKLKSGLMRRMFSGEGVNTKLGEIASIVRGGSPRPIEDYITDEPEGLNWLKIGDIEQGAKYITHTSQKIKPAGLKKTTMVHSGDFILSNSMSFGRPYIMKIDACIHDGWLAFKDVKTNLIDSEFLYYLLSSELLQKNFTAVAAGSGVKNLKRESVSNIVVKLPPLDKQKEITRILSSIDDKVTVHKKIRSNLFLLKKGLMQDLLTGKVRTI